MALDIIPKTDESNLGKDIEKFPSGTSPDTKDKTTPVDNAIAACVVLSILIWVVVLVICFIVEDVLDNSLGVAVLYASLALAVATALFPCVISSSTKLNPSNPSSSRLFFIFLYHNLSMWGLLAMGAAMQREFKVL